MSMNRRRFLGAAGVAALGLGGSANRLLAATPDRTAVVPDASLKTKHLVVILYGNGCRKKDTVEDRAHAPHMARMMDAGSVFTEDFGETANLHGYMYTEMLTGRETVSEHPLYPTWTETVRKELGGSVNDYWMLQGVSYYRSWVLRPEALERPPGRRAAVRREFADHEQAVPRRSGAVGGRLS